MSTAPLRTTRLASLFLAFAFGVIGTGVGINALVKFENQKHALQRMVPAGASVTIDTNDILSSGIVLTIVCGLTALASLLFFLPLFSPSKAGRFLGVQTAIFGFLSVWLFAVLVPFTDFFANRSAKVFGTIGGFPLPAAAIQQVEQEVGSTPVYRKVHYLLLPAVICWFTFLFAVIATFVSYLAMRHARLHSSYPVYANSVDHDVVSEKGNTKVAQRDV